VLGIDRAEKMLSLAAAVLEHDGAAAQLMETIEQTAAAARK
jgi:hypothetical protein